MGTFSNCLRPVFESGQTLAFLLNKLYLLENSYLTKFSKWLFDELLNKLQNNLRNELPAVDKCGKSQACGDEIRQIEELTV